MVRRHARRPEPPAGDLHGRWMVPQERIPGARGRDARAQLSLRLGRRLAQSDTVSTVGRDPIEDGRRPLATPHHPDDRRVRQSQRRHQRIHLGGVAVRLVDLERLGDDEQVVQRRYALAALRGVGGATGDREPKRDGAGVGDHDIQVGRFGDDREVRDGAGSDRGQRALPSVLLRRYEHDHQFPIKVPEGAARLECADGSEDGRDTALHVTGAATIESTVADVARPRVRGPRGRIARRHHVEVSGQDDPPTADAPGSADDHRQRRSRHLLAGPVGVRPDGLRIRGDQLHGEAHIAQGLGSPLGDRFLRPGDRWDPDERLEILHHAFTIDDRRDRGEVRGAGRHVRRVAEGVSHGGSAGSCRWARRSR